MRPTPGPHCRALPAELFFADRHGRYPVPTEQLRRMCLGDPALGVPACPVVYACLERALASGAKGWQAGTDETGRARIRRVRAAAA